MLIYMYRDKIIDILPPPPLRCHKNGQNCEIHKSKFTKKHQKSNFGSSAATAPTAPRALRAARRTSRTSTRTKGSRDAEKRPDDRAGRDHLGGGR